MVGQEYFETLGISRLAGRDFGAENPTAPKVDIVNEEFVKRFFQGENSVGHTVNGAGVPYEIVGVVKDTKSRTIGEQQRPVLYRSINQNVASDPSQDGYTVMARYEGDAATLTKAMENQIHAVDPALAIFNTQTMEEHLHEALFLPRLVGVLFSVFGLGGVTLASVGLYGVMSYSVSQRTKEIGVRMALGARATEVQRMVVRGGMRMALVSVVLGLPMAACGGEAVDEPAVWREAVGYRDVHTGSSTAGGGVADCVLDTVTAGFAGRSDGGVALRWVIRHP